MNLSKDLNQVKVMAVHLSRGTDDRTGKMKSERLLAGLPM